MATRGYELYLHCARWRYDFLVIGKILVFHQYLYNNSQSLFRELQIKLSIFPCEERVRITTGVICHMHCAVATLAMNDRQPSAKNGSICSIYRAGLLKRNVEDRDAENTKRSAIVTRQFSRSASGKRKLQNPKKRLSFSGFRDIQNYQGLGKCICYQPQPSASASASASADNTYFALDNSPRYHKKPHPIIVYSWILISYTFFINFRI